jgi:proteic killer suppression protein
MELCATADEVQALRAAHAGEPFLLFPEVREYPIRMTDDLPLRWIERGPGGALEAAAQRNEYFVFQVGVYAVDRDLTNLRVTFTDLTSGANVIPAAGRPCLNGVGADRRGADARRKTPRTAFSDRTNDLIKVGFQDVPLRVCDVPYAPSLVGVIVAHAPGRFNAPARRIDNCNAWGYTRGVIRSFRHKGLERFFQKGSKSGIRPEHAARLRLLLARLHGARTPQDMALPGLRLHALSGERKGCWAVDVSGNWRVVFRFDEHDVVEVDYLDYH